MPPIYYTRYVSKTRPIENNPNILCVNMVVDEKRAFVKKARRSMVMVVGLLLLTLVAAGPLTSHVEVPMYTSVSVNGAIDIREYPPMMVAQVAVEGL